MTSAGAEGDVHIERQVFHIASGLNLLAPAYQVEQGKQQQYAEACHGAEYQPALNTECRVRPGTQLLNYWNPDNQQSQKAQHGK